MIDSMDKIVAALTGASDRFFAHKLFGTSIAVGQWMSAWTAGGFPGAGAIPPSGGGETCDKNTPGALLTTAGGPLTDPGVGQELRVLHAAAAETSNNRGNMIAYDRLVHTSGLDGILATAQTVNTVALPARAAGGAGVEIFVEIYVQLGTTARVLTVNYTNQDGVAQTTSVANIGGSSGIGQRNVGQIAAVPLAVGDTGARSVQSVQLAGSTLTAGNFGITLARRLFMVEVFNTNSLESRDALRLGLPVVDQGACLALMANKSTSGIVSYFDMTIGRG